MTVRARSWQQIGTTVAVVVSDGDLDTACAAVRGLIVDADHAFSRFRDDSELSIVNRSGGRHIHVSKLFGAAIDAALAAARASDGLVDPSVGRAVRMTGYDRDFALLRALDDRSPVPMQFVAVPGWQAVSYDSATHLVQLPRGVELDLDATGKALIVDLAARAAAETQPSATGVLVSIGGDIRVLGRAPRGGWRIALDEDSAAPSRRGAPVAVIRDGALATSSTTVRRWRRNGRILHHLIDPRTGEPATGPWRTATVVAPDCVTANVAATCAIVLGDAARTWLEERAIPARLVANDGSVAYVSGWPEDLPIETPAAA